MIVARLAVVAVLVASGAVILYGLAFDTTGRNIAFTIAGLAVFGATLAFVSAWFLVTSLRAAREGRGGRAVFGGLLGGLVAIVASLALAAASIFVLLTQTVT